MSSAGRSSAIAAWPVAWASTDSTVKNFACLQVFKVVEVNRVLTWNFYLRRILPVGLFMALTLLCGNLVYLYLTVSFIQMLKARPSTLHAGG